MANSQKKQSLATPTTPVGAKRGGPAHLVDGIGGGKGLVTTRELTTGGIETQPANSTTDKGLGGKLV